MRMVGHGRNAVAQGDPGAPGARVMTEYGRELERIRINKKISRGLIGYRVTAARAETGSGTGKRGGGPADATHVRRWFTGEYIVDPVLAALLHAAVEATPEEEARLWRAYMATRISSAGTYPDQAREALAELTDNPGEIRDLFARAIDERPEVEGLPTAPAPAAVAQTGRSRRTRQTPPDNPITVGYSGIAGRDPAQVGGLTLPRETVSPLSVAA